MTSRSWSLVSIIMAGAMALSLGSCARPSGDGPSVGVQFHGVWADYTDATRAGVLDRLAAAGVQRVRIDVSWAGLQPDGPDSISPAGERLMASAVDAALARGLRPLVTLWLTPPWANQGRGEHTPPDDPADYARIARWAAARWAGRVDWEVWNEPNSEDFFVGDQAAYARLLCAAYPAFHRGDPRTTVVGGGTEYVDTDWLRRMYDAGAHGCFDVLSVHPYPGTTDQPPDAPDDGTPGTLLHVTTVRALMEQRGDADRSIWFTELGWSTHGPDPTTGVTWRRGVTEAQQADDVRRALRVIRTRLPYVTAVFFYRDRDQVTGDIHFDHFGLLRRDLSPKPALAAIRDR